MLTEKSPIHVNSEIGRLKTVILHRPGKEIENLTPDTMGPLLFDDIPYLLLAQKEHDNFADTLRKKGVEVLYLEKLVVQALETDEQVKAFFIDKMIAESGFKSGTIHDQLQKFLVGLPTNEMVDKIMAGVRFDEIEFSSKDLQNFSFDQTRPFLMAPMPNLYFTRDPSASIGDGLTINRMTFKARRRESMFTELVINHHPRFANKNINVWRDRNHVARLEGGDELVLSDHVLAIGLSQRTSSEAIKDVAKNLFAGSNYDTVITIQIPQTHATMHLDTVFTMVNFDQFTVHPMILNNKGELPILVMHKDKQNQIKIESSNNLKTVLKEQLGLNELDLISTGDGDPIISAREQWNDGSNTLAIAPGSVVTYDRNYVSNEALRKHGIQVSEVPSSEISRGRGGPRCMSMPIYREDIEN
ncbi:arginine deiminase [Oenococcus oeni]|uniref:arginine deiminase n=1 Tax=Oenococcus oeni TaxID=1247 RepID=UPI0010AF3B42|nr:arginine deiminase [Oenococcus oeni]SYW16696.1 Arginine deiminase [Oenococcus oeni]